MKVQPLILKIVLIIGVFLLAGGVSYAQQMDKVIAATDEQGILRVIQFKFDTSIVPENILDINVFSLGGNESLIVGKHRVSSNAAIPNLRYEVNLNAPLTVTTLQNGTRKLNEYIFAVKIKNNAGEAVWQNARIILPDVSNPAQTVTKDESESIEDSALYIDGEMNGAYKKKTSFSTNIKVKRLTQKGKWVYSASPIDSLPIPFYFKLNASTDVEADPDSMEIGFNFARVVGTHFYWDNDVKLESQRDFKNTNFIYATRGSWRPAGVSLTKKDGDATSTLFFRPFIGVEVGKNLKSPVDAAEGDGIARILTGADLRLNIPINLDKGQEINWTNSYTRRWLLTDELGFKADDDGNLQLVRFGKSPRDYFNSKASLNFNKFFGGFVEYEWGQLPPSYKFVDHRFRLGLFYRFKFAVK